MANRNIPDFLEPLPVMRASLTTRNIQQTFESLFYFEDLIKEKPDILFAYKATLLNNMRRLEIVLELSYLDKKINPTIIVNNELGVNHLTDYFRQLACFFGLRMGYRPDYEI